MPQLTTNFMLVLLLLMLLLLLPLLLLLLLPLLLLLLQVGLRYYDDFMQPMPRAEVAEVERLVYEAVADTLQVGVQLLLGCISAFKLA
jgi:hypothetical protein